MDDVYQGECLPASLVTLLACSHVLTHLAALLCLPVGMPEEGFKGEPRFLQVALFPSPAFIDMTMLTMTKT